MQIELNPNEAAIYAYIKQRLEQDGHSPTWNEIATGAGVSRSEVSRGIRVLVASGRLVRVNRQGRAALALPDGR